MGVDFGICSHFGFILVCSMELDLFWVWWCHVHLGISAACHRRPIRFLVLLCIACAGSCLRQTGVHHPRGVGWGGVVVWGPHSGVMHPVGGMHSCLSCLHCLGSTLRYRAPRARCGGGGVICTGASLPWMRQQLAGGILKAVGDGLNTMVKSPSCTQCVECIPSYHICIVWGRPSPQRPDPTLPPEARVGSVGSGRVVSVSSGFGSGLGGV